MAITLDFKTGSYLILLSVLTGASVLVFLGNYFDNTASKSFLEGLTVAITFITFIGLMLLFRANNFKNVIIFEMLNILLCSLSISLLICYARENSINKNDGKNIAYLVLISIVIILTSLILFNDIFNLGVSKNKGLNKLG